MEVVGFLSALIVFLGVPTGIFVAQLAREEHAFFSKYASILSRLTLVLTFIIFSFVFHMQFALPLSLASLIILFFSIPAQIYFSLLPFYFFFRAEASFPALLSSLFLYAFIVGISLYSPQKKSYSLDVISFAPFLIVSVLLLVLTR